MWKLAVLNNDTEREIGCYQYQTSFANNGHVCWTNDGNTNTSWHWPSENFARLFSPDSFAKLQQPLVGLRNWLIILGLQLFGTFLKWMYILAWERENFDIAFFRNVNGSMLTRVLIFQSLKMYGKYALFNWPTHWVSETHSKDFINGSQQQQQQNIFVKHTHYRLER